jgi:hypothetical protein
MNRLHLVLIVGTFVCALSAGQIVAQETAVATSDGRLPLAFPLPALQQTAGTTGSASQDFEGGTFPPAGWTNVASGSYKWLLAGASGYGVGSLSAAAAFFSVPAGASLSLMTPLFTPAVAGDSVIFDHAYCTYSTENDQLEVGVSTNGGASWTALATLDGGTSGALATAPAKTTSFVPSAAQWATKRYPLGTGVNRVRFRAISAYGNNLFLDNISGWKAFDSDAMANSIDYPGQTVAPASFYPKGTVGNAGGAAITFSANLTITPGGYSSSRTVTSLAAGASAQVTFDSWTPAPGVYQCMLVCSNASDQNRSNDTVTATRIVATGVHTPLLEFATGTWCQWCPCGDLTAEALTEAYPGLVVIAYHGGGGGDPFLNYTGNSIISALGFSGYPTAIIDRQNFPLDFSQWTSTMQSRMATAASPISIAITGRSYNPSTRELTFNVETTPNITLPILYKLGVALTENNLVYTQTGNTNCPGSTTWVHNWVCRGVLSPVTGTTLNTATWTSGQKASTAVTTTLDASWIPANCRINAYVFQAGATLGMSEVVNATSDVVVTGIEDGAGTTPVEYALQQNYPNPFNPTTSIAFSIPKAGFISLKIYDVAGREVMTGLEETLQPGQYNVQVDARNLASGVYFYTLSTASFTQTKKMTLMK